MAARESFFALESPEVFELSPAQIAEALAERRRAVEALAITADDRTARTVLDGLVTDLEVTDPVLERALIEDAEAAAEVGVSWQFVVFTGPSVTRLQREAYFRIRETSWPIARAEAACVAPERLEPPDEDRSARVEPGTIVFDPIGTADSGLLAVDSAGGAPERIPAPDGWDDLDEPTVAPDGRTVVAIARRDGPTPAVGVAVGNVIDGFTEVFEVADADLACPRALADGRLLVTRLDGGGRPNTLLSIENGIGTAIDLPVADFFCAEQRRDGGLLLGAAQVNRARIGGLGTLSPGADTITPTYVRDECANVITGLSPDERTELVVQTCRDMTRSGLYAVDLASGDAEQLVAWPAATARLVAGERWQVVPAGEQPDHCGTPAPSVGPSGE